MWLPRLFPCGIYRSVGAMEPPGGFRMVRLLLEKGADVGLRERGTDSLHLASQYGNETIICLLLENGADIDAQYFGRQTALHLASRSGCAPPSACCSRKVLLSRSRPARRQALLLWRQSADMKRPSAFSSRQVPISRPTTVAPEPHCIWSRARTTMPLLGFCSRKVLTSVPTIATCERRYTRRPNANTRHSFACCSLTASTLRPKTGRRAPRCTWQSSGLIRILLEAGADIETKADFGAPRGT